MQTFLTNDASHQKGFSCLGTWIILGLAFGAWKGGLEKKCRSGRKKQTVSELEKENQALQLRLSLAQDDLQRAQINAHLLFNALNFIHSEIQEQSPKTAEAVIALSEMMRYALSETQEDGKVALTGELEQIAHLIQIHQCRFQVPSPIRFTTAGALDNKRFIPLLLLPLVENLVKYADPAEQAVVHLEAEVDRLHFSTFNKKKAAADCPSLELGLANVRSRLQRHYPNAHSLHVVNGPQSYQLWLSIIL